MITRIGVAVLVTFVICAACDMALARRTTVDLGSTDVAVRESSDESYGSYFLIDVAVPDGIAEKELLTAVLEFYVDVAIRIDSVVVEEPDTTYTVRYRNPVPLMEVYALTSAAGQTLDPRQWNEAFSFPTPIGVGADKIVRIDITRLVKYYLENPEENHGLIIGSLTGRRPGHFSLRENLGAGVRARIRYSYDLYKW